MNKLGAALERIGMALAILGGACFAAIFLIVIVNGSWPDFLEPVRSRYALANNLVGEFAFVVEILCFTGPGLLISALGAKLQNSN